MDEETSARVKGEQNLKLELENKLNQQIDELEYKAKNKFNNMEQNFINIIENLGKKNEERHNELITIFKTLQINDEKYQNSKKRKKMNQAMIIILDQRN